jgi:hypothetical protein
MDRFLTLCHSIRFNCWQQIHEDEASRGANSEVLRRAYGEYKRQVQPWLSAMIEAYGIDAEVLVHAPMRPRAVFSPSRVMQRNLP